MGEGAHLAVLREHAASRWPPGGGQKVGAICMVIWWSRSGVGELGSWGSLGRLLGPAKGSYKGTDGKARQGWRAKHQRPVLGA